MGGQAEPPMVDLGKFAPNLPVPDLLRERADDLGVSLAESGGVLSTRSQARAVVKSRPDVQGTVYLKADKIEIATPSFFHELLKHWPHAQLAGANRDVQESWNLVIREEPHD